MKKFFAFLACGIAELFESVACIIAGIGLLGISLILWLVGAVLSCIPLAIAVIVIILILKGLGVI